MNFFNRVRKMPTSAQKKGKLTQGDLNPTLDLQEMPIRKDTFTPDLLRHLYGIHHSYVTSLLASTKTLGVKVRSPVFPEYLSENMIKTILHKGHDTTSTWGCDSGDLHSALEGKQECKCFTSDGPLSFTPSSNWDVIYFMDARGWLQDSFQLYRIPLRRTSDEWKAIHVNKTQTFEDQVKQGRRPRLTWDYLHPQIAPHCTKIFDGSFEDMFTPTSP